MFVQISRFLPPVSRMFPEVTTCLQFDKINLDKSTVVVTDDLLGSSDFLTNYVLGYALKQGLKIVFVSWSEPFAHYQAISARCGVDVAGPLARGDLVFFDALAGMDSLHEEDLETLFQSVQTAATTDDHSKRERLIIVDHPTNLLDVGLPVHAVLRFLSHCLSIDECGLYVSLKTSEFLPDNERLFGVLTQFADVVVRVSTLDSGMSRDVSGEVFVHFNVSGDDYEDDAKKLKEAIVVKSERFLYRLESRQVKMTCPGGSLLRK
jgi:hypothetical protein